MRWKFESYLFTITAKVAPAISDASKIPIVICRGSQSMKFTTKQMVSTPVHGIHKSKATAIVAQFANADNTKHSIVFCNIYGMISHIKEVL